ncbi:MAG: glycoside hydrolase family 78 protein [Dysgonamonadaceae bacterium]|jgi:alpha-L-rhamnosidase|nr:glycoside hydrolase family 78 protein [Dysgonamonadaceae bacterium]
MKNNCFYFLFIALSFVNLISCRPQSAPSLVELKCENLINANAIDNTTPHFSWKILYDGGAMQQQFYEIQVASDSTELTQGNADLWNTGKFQSDESVMVPYQGKTLTSRSLCYWRVRIWNDKGEVSAWSHIARFGVGILSKKELQGKFIGLSADAGNTHTPLLRKKFTVEESNIAFLHVNSLGYHEVYINGKRVGDDVLSPAVSHLTKRSITVTYDVTSCLQPGENELVFWLGTGWYTRTGFQAEHDGALVNAQLDQRNKGQWQTILATGATWQGRETGYRDTGTWQALRFGGERVDAKLNPADLTSKTLDALTWRPVVEVDVPNIEIAPEMTEPNKIRETLVPQSITPEGNNTWLVDLGKNINGWFEIKFPRLQAGDTVSIEYTDYIDKGVFQEQGQRDIYIASGKANEVFRNKFNHHAFRYARITNLAEKPQKDDIRAYLIHTDYRVASSFECSDADLNAIHDMIQYTMRCLAFGGYMVDCPHLERAGYGGDGNSSTMTLQTMYDVSPLFTNWLMAWSDAMREGGSLPHVAPNPGAGGGGPYWCGFFVLAPWRTYLNYNDARLIERYYPAMKQWFEYVDKYTVDGLLKRWPDLEYRDWYLGDWLAPWGVDSGAQSSVDLVNNCFISECLGVMAKIAGILNKPDEAEEWKNRKEALNRLIHHTFFDAGKHIYATGSQLDLSYPMLVGVTPAPVYEKVKNQLFERTETQNQGHIGVGLVGVPILTEWAIQNKAVDFFYTLLKKRDYPGYLNMIDNGATTTWEYWSGERSRIHNCYNGIGTWFYQAVGGIRPDENNPGYRHVFIEPQIPGGVTWAKITKETPYGTIAVDWQLESPEKFSLNVSLPAGTTATIAFPKNVKNCWLNGKKIKKNNRVVEI